MSDYRWGALLLLFVAGVAWLVNIMAVVRQHDRWEEQDRLDHEEWDRLLTMQPLRFPVEWEAPASDIASDLVYAAMLTSSRFTVSERLIRSVDDTELRYLASASRPFTQWRDEHVRGYTIDLTTGTLEDRKLLGTVLREIRRRHHEPMRCPEHGRAWRGSA